jgi:BASS family bile acid:Na+ symporter
MNAIDQVVVHFEPGQLGLLNLLLGFLMFSIALDINLSGFRQLWQFPKGAVVGLSVQYLFFPLFTLALAWLLKPAPSVALGMAIIAACPSGNIAHYASFLARANVTLAIGLGACITLLAWISTPLTFAWLAMLMPGTQSLAKQFTISPLDMVLKIVQLIVIPLMLGVAMQHFLPRITQLITKAVRLLALVLFFGVIIGALMGNYQNLKVHLPKVFWLVFILNGVALATGYIAGTVLKLPVADRRTLAFESGVHNTGLGLILIFNFFDGLGGMAVMAAWYGIWDMMTVLILAVAFRLRDTQLSK